MSFSFHVPTNLVFGQGAIQKLHKQRLPGKHALIVISSGKSTRANGYLDIVQDQLTQAGVTYTVFDKILANPVLDNVMDGAACARANGCDFVLGLGGGSSIDAAKAIAMMAPNEGNYWDYMYGGTGGVVMVLEGGEIEQSQGQFLELLWGSVHGKPPFFWRKGTRPFLKKRRV